MLPLHLLAGNALLAAAASAGAGALPATHAFTNSLGQVLVRIEPGSFVMGSAASGDFDERPARRVTLTQPYCVAVTEVTNAQYEQFDPQHRQLRGKLGFAQGDDEAAVFVSWYEADRFCQWLAEREGLPYRLPTEAEWEYACRAGSTTAFCFGDTLPEACLKNARESWYPDPARSMPDEVVALTVAQTPPNPWGLFDMHGNVEEWCRDWYGPYPGFDRQDPRGPDRGDFRITRGGSHSTTPEFLRSANRSGTLPEDRSWLIGFRVALAPLPDSPPSPGSAPSLNEQAVSAALRPDAIRRSDPARPRFAGPRPYVKVPPGAGGPMFAEHNHDPAVANCPNGDLLAIWYSCRREPGRELGILASRLRHGTKEWELASPFWDAPDRNDHAPALWFDGERTLYHFNGLSAAATWGNLATILRTSTDSGATWSAAQIIMPEHGLRHMPVETVFRARDGQIVLPCDAVTGGSGGTAIHLSADNGRSWEDPGGTILGIHAPVVQLGDGRLFALGRGDAIDGRMPQSVSADMGRSWTSSASPFPPLGGGQRAVLLRLAEGPILLASFAPALTTVDAAGAARSGSGLFAALSTDEGATWPVRRLVTDDGPPRELDGGGNTGRFVLGPDSAEPKGYLSICQRPDGNIHLISSKQHYAFNLAWINAPAPTPPPRTHVGIRGGKWLINGQITYPGSAAEGLLMNVRMVNAVFEDANRAEFEPDANLQEFLDALPDYVAHGVRAFTICLQGGFPGYEGAVNSAFEFDGTLRDSYMLRVARVIDACDRAGAAVILGCFYQRQDQILRDEEAVRGGLAKLLGWLAARPYRNVLLEIANEFPHGGFDHPILGTPAGQVELLALAERLAPNLLVSTSGIGDGRLHEDVAAASDFLLVHFNGVAPNDIPPRIAALRRFGKPIVCNEDDKTGADAARAARLSVGAGASWGFMHEAVNQRFPFQFDGRADDPEVYDTLLELTGLGAPSRAE